MGNKVHRWQHQHRPGTHPLWRSWNFHLTWLLNKTIIHVHSFMILGDEAVIYDHRWFFSWFTFPPFTFIHLWFLGMRMTLSDMAELAKFKWFAGHSICHTSLGRGSQDRRVGGHPFWAPRGPEIWEGLDFQPPILRVNRNCRPSRQPTIISKCLLDLCINPVRHIGYVGRSLSGGSLGERLDQTHRCRFRQDSLRNGLKSRVCSKDATVATFKVCEGILAC